MQLFSADAIVFSKNGPETEIPYHQKPLNAGLGI